MTARDVLRVARLKADRNSRRLKDARDAAGDFYATVASVTGGAASDGLAVVTVTIRGDETTAAGYNLSYTPAVGQRVICTYINNQLNIICAVGGAP